MKHDKSQDFRFRMNNESTQPYYQEDVEDQRLKRLGRRVTILTILIPSLLGLVLFFGYQDLKKGYSNLRDTDMVKSEKLSQILDSKFSSISIQVAKLEESLGTIQDDFKTLEASFNKKVMPLNEIYLVFEKTTSALKDNLKNTEKTIDRLSASKSDKTDVTTAIDKIEKKISPFYQHLKNMEAEIKALDENLTQELAELSSDLYKVKNGLKQFDTIKKEINDPKLLGYFVNKTPGSIGFFGYGSMRAFHDDVGKIIKIEGVEPTRENIISKKYMFAAHYHLVFDRTSSNEKLKKFLEFVNSTSGREIINQNFVSTDLIKQ